MVKVIDSLKENNLYENTIIIFTSDHGEMMGDRGMLEKEHYMKNQQECQC